MTSTRLWHDSRISGLDLDLSYICDRLIAMAGAPHITKERETHTSKIKWNMDLEKRLKKDFCRFKLVCTSQWEFENRLAPVTHCNTLQCTTTHCNTPQSVPGVHGAIYRNDIKEVSLSSVSLRCTHCTTLHRTATHCNTLSQRYQGGLPLSRVSTVVQWVAVCCRVLQWVAVSCSVLQCLYPYGCLSRHYGVATVSRIDNVIGLFCRILSLL